MRCVDGRFSISIARYYPIYEHGLTNTMSSATDRTTASFEVGAVAHVNFRARCERLGHGEEVFLVAEEDKGRTKVGVVSCRMVRMVNHGLHTVEVSTTGKIDFRMRFLDVWM
jgi:L-amino acid N-acyltransferase YncA